MSHRNLNLLELIYGLVERLMLTTEFNNQEIEALLTSILDDLDGICQHYEAPAPEGTEAVQELMLESLGLFAGAIEEIRKFLEDQDEARLAKAVHNGEEANDILSAVEEIITTNKQILSEMVEA